MENCSENSEPSKLVHVEPRSVFSPIGGPINVITLSSKTAYSGDKYKCDEIYDQDKLLQHLQVTIRS